MRFFKLFIVAGVFCLIPNFLFAQELHQDVQEVVSATVIEITGEFDRTVPGTDTVVHVQNVRAMITSGEKKGEVTSLSLEVVKLEAGDKFFLNHIVTFEGDEYYNYADFERRPALIALGLLFVAALLFFARMQGLRALLSLAASAGIIFFLLVPALLRGYDPVLTITGIAALVMACVLYGTHGITARTHIAFAGTMGAVILTGALALISVKFMHLSGFTDDASVYLNFATDGALNLSGILLGSIIVGILGILDDVAVTQASVVQELKAANPLFTTRELYDRALNVGRDHLGSLVNTLALAYVGVALPLILLYAKTETDILFTLSREVIAVELLRILVGSIGLIMTVPATTAMAAWYFSRHTVDAHDVVPHHHH